MERAVELRVSAGQFMGSVLVARDGRVLLSKGYGGARWHDHARASSSRRRCFTPGHSAATMEKRAESRALRSAPRR